MPIPVVHEFPVKRPGFITAAQWLGQDDDLALQITFPDLGGIPRSLSFDTKNPTTAGEICIPSSNNLNDLGPRARDILVAHTRMACMIRGRAVPGSKEFETAFIDQLQATNLQTAVGTVKITAVNIVSDALADVTYQQGNGPLYTVTLDHGELGRYVFVPDTQLFVVPGSVEKQFPNYVHNYPGQVLTAQQKADVVAYVLTLAPWI